MKASTSDKYAIVLAYVFTVLLASLFFFKGDANLLAILGTQIGVIVGALCGLAQNGNKNQKVDADTINVGKQ